MLMKINKKMVYLGLCVFVIIIISVYIKNYKNKNLQNETINSSILEPNFIIESISPLNLSLTADIPNQNGGLSYLKNNTDDLNLKFVHDYYKQLFNIVLPEDTHIIFGSGTTAMVQALYYALAKKLQRTVSVNTNMDIYYTLHKKLADILKNVEWTDTPYSDLAVIASPNNPLGTITDPKTIHNKYMLYDVVYDIPIISGKFQTVNEELYKEFERNKNIFITSSLSKLGIPGVRCGFLLTRDTDIANYCTEYINTTTIRYPTASIAIGRIAYYKYYKYKSWHLKNYDILTKRRNEFVKLCEKCGIEILNNPNLPLPSMYTNKSADWWKSTFNIETRPGSDFNDTNDHSRVNLMITEDYWKEFIRRLQM